MANWSLPLSLIACICMMIAGIETFTAVTAILSFGCRSFSDLRCGALVLRYIGIDVIAATPFTRMLARVRSQIVMNAGGPAGAKCAAPASSMSLTTAGPPSLTYSAVSFRPIFWASASTSLLLLHHDQRQEADAARAFRDLHHVDFGLRERGNEQQRRNENALHRHAFLLDLDAREFLERFHELGDVGVRPLRGLADRHHLAHRVADDHRHAERLRLVEAELDVLVEQRGGEAEVEAARHERSAGTCPRSRCCGRSRVDHVEHGGRIEAGLDAHHHRLGRDRDARSRRAGC